MSSDGAALVEGLAVVGIVIGLAGLVLPFVPGPAVIWLSCLAWAWADGFQKVGWPTLTIITAMAVVAQGSDLVMGALGARRSGVPIGTLVASSVASVVGFFVFNFPGAVLGAAVAILVVETRRLGGDWRSALKTGKALLIAYVLALAFEVVLSLSMVALFVYQVAIA